MSVMSGRWTWTATSAVDGRDGVIDTMRGIAILMVIGIHALPKPDGSALVTIIDASLRPCVAIFLFASGYLTARTGDVPLGKRVRRALGPYTVAFVAAYLFMAASNPAMDHRPGILVARYVFAYVFVYYYVFVYVGCTLMLWLILAAGGESAGAQQRRLLLFAFAILFGLAVGAYDDAALRNYGLSESLIEEVRLRNVPFWFAFMAAGAIVGQSQSRTLLRAWRLPLALLTVVAFTAYAFIRIVGIGDAAPYDSMAFFLYAVLLCLTLLAVSMDTPNIALLGTASYFIYLWHIFPIMALRGNQTLAVHPLLAFLAQYAAALAFALLGVVLLRHLAGPRRARALGA